MVELVTILILIDGFLQSNKHLFKKYNNVRHNPYFNRWFSAIMIVDDATAHISMSQSLF